MLIAETTQSLASEAEIKPQAAKKVCPNCGSKFDAGGRGLGKRHCSTKCRVDFNNRCKAEGAVIITLAKVWIANRHAKPGSKAAEVCGEARRELNEIVSIFLDADKDAGRPSLVDYVAEMLGETRYIDRTRKF